MPEWWMETEYRAFIDELLERAPESWDGDASVESVAIQYVRALEDRVVKLGGSLERDA